MSRASFFVQPVTFRRPPTPFEVKVSSAREIHLVPAPGTVVMRFGGRSYAVEEKVVGSPVILDDGRWSQSDFSRPESFGFFCYQDRPAAGLPENPAIQLRNALMTCKRMGLKGSHIQEVWDEFVTRQVLES